MGIADLCLMTDHLGLACLQGNLSGLAESGLATAQRQFADYLDGLLMVGIVLHLGIHKDAVACLVVPDVYSERLHPHLIGFDERYRTEDAERLTALRESPF